MDIKKTWLCTDPIAHRGLHNNEKPENSIAAFKNACVVYIPIKPVAPIINTISIYSFSFNASAITYNGRFLTSSNIFPI